MFIHCWITNFAKFSVLEHTARLREFVGQGCGHASTRSFASGLSQAVLRCWPGKRTHRDLTGEVSVSKMTYVVVGRILFSCELFNWEQKSKFLACIDQNPSQFLALWDFSSCQLHQRQHEMESAKKLDITIFGTQSPPIYTQYYHILWVKSNTVVQFSLKKRGLYMSVNIRRHRTIKDYFRSRLQQTWFCKKWALCFISN